MEKILKRHISLSEQARLLESRGLIMENHSAVEQALGDINYYRLSGYLHDFKRTGSDSYTYGLTWDRLKRIYDFDRKFTRILMFALEDIEETLKTRLSYTITSHFPSDPIIYLKPNIYRDYETYQNFLYRFFKEKENNSNLPFVKHHNDVYGGYMPMWVAVEIFTMGNLYAVYKNLLPRYQKELAKIYGTGPRQLQNWIQNLTYIRNHLAHYMRIYSFNFGRSPAECKRHPRQFPVSNMIFDQIFVMQCMYSSPNEWNEYVLSEIQLLIDEYSDAIILRDIGFPDDWEEILTRKVPALTTG